MANCIFCKSKAGLLKKQHKACLDKYNKGVSLLKDEVVKQVKSSFSADKLECLILTLNKEYYLDENNLKLVMTDIWENCVELIFEEGLSTKKEDDNLISIANLFNLEQDDLNKNRAFEKLGKGAVLRDLQDGKIPNRIDVEGELPFNFLKTENLIWVLSSVDYYENKTKRRYEGDSSGVSFRVAKGVYVRSSSFKGHPVDYEETIYQDTGLVAITDKYIYFSGEMKEFRVAFNKIISFKPFSDGVRFQTEAVSAKPKIFIVDDGWFLYNLLTSISKFDKG